jgi:hypothetical protein
LTGTGKVIELFDVIVESAQRDKLLASFSHELQIAENLGPVRLAGSRALVALSDRRDG